MAPRYFHFRARHLANDKINDLNTKLRIMTVLDNIFHFKPLLNSKESDKVGIEM